MKRSVWKTGEGDWGQYRIRRLVLALPEPVDYTEIKERGEETGEKGPRI